MREAREARWHSQTLRADMSSLVGSKRKAEGSDEEKERGGARRRSLSGQGRMPVSAMESLLHQPNIAEIVSSFSPRVADMMAWARVAPLSDNTPFVEVRIGAGATQYVLRERARDIAARRGAARGLVARIRWYEEQQQDHADSVFMEVARLEHRVLTCPDEAEMWALLCQGRAFIDGYVVVDALCAAIEQGRQGVARVVIAFAGEFLGGVPPSFSKALNTAIQCGNLDIARLLRTEGVVTTTVSVLSRTLKAAMIAGNEAMVDFVRELVRQKQIKMVWLTAICSAVSYSSQPASLVERVLSWEEVRKDVASGADAAVRSEMCAALYGAVRRRQVDTVRCILSACGHIFGGEWPRLGQDPALEAVRRGSVEMLQLLHDFGVDVKFRDKRDAMLCAVSVTAAGGGEVLKWLLDTGDREYLGDRTLALRHAARAGSVEAVRVLLQAGARVGPKSIAVRWAAEAGHAEVVALLRAHQKAKRE